MFILPLLLGVKGLDESELNLTLLAVESHHIDSSPNESELKVGMSANKLEQSDNAGIQSLIADVKVDVHNRTSIMYLLPDSKGF